MPIYEYKCPICGNMEEVLTKTIAEGENIMQFCPVCRVKGTYCVICLRVLSVVNFRVTGFNSANGYNLPHYDDVIDKRGYAKPEWSKD